MKKILLLRMPPLLLLGKEARLLLWYHLQSLHRKGLICCEINTCHELLGTEIILSSLLHPLDPIEAVAILSALIFQEKVEPSSMEGIVDELTPNMEIAKVEIITILYRLNMIEGNGDNSEEGNLLEDVTTNLTSALNNKPVLNFGLCPVIYERAKGTSFKEIAQITTFQEGSIASTITRLNELCRAFQMAAVYVSKQYYRIAGVYFW
jgi:antiviral helicase SKI2